MPVNGNVLKAKGNVLTHVSDIAYPQKSVIRYMLFWFDVMTSFRIVMIGYLFSSNLQVCPRPPDDLKIRKIDNIVNSILLMTQSNPLMIIFLVMWYIYNFTSMCRYIWFQLIERHARSSKLLQCLVQKYTSMHWSRKKFPRGVSNCYWVFTCLFHLIMVYLECRLYM